MAPVIPGRFTAQMDEPFVVFLIGMRVTALWRSGSGSRPRELWARWSANCSKTLRRGF
jgi:hypothetical protein